MKKQKCSTNLVPKRLFSHYRYKRAERAQENLLFEGRRMSPMRIDCVLGRIPEKRVHHVVVTKCIKMMASLCTWMSHDLGKGKEKKGVINICHRHKAQSRTDLEFLNSTFKCGGIF